MKENKHGFKPKQEFKMGGINWTIIQTGEDWVECITSDCIEKRNFNQKNKNDFSASSLRAYLNDEFLCRLIKVGAPREMFEYFNINLTADDGSKNTTTTISAKPMQSIAVAMGFCSQKKSKQFVSNMMFRKLHLLVWLERKIMPLLVTKMAVCKPRPLMIELC